MATAGPAGPEKSGLTVAAVPATGAAGLYIAQQAGLFARQGLHVTILPSVSAADVVPGLLSGRIDVSLGQWTTAIILQAKHYADLKVLAAGNSEAPGLQQVMVPPKSGITSPRRLKGKTIAVNVLGGLSELLVLDDLAGYGIQPGQVHFVAVPFPQEQAALKAHRVDAAFMVEPFVSEAETADGDTPVLDIGQGPTAGFPIVGYVVTRAWANRYPKTAAAFARAVDAGQKIADTNRGEVERVLRYYIRGLGGTASLIALGNYPVSVDPKPLMRVGTLMQKFPSVSGLPTSVNVPAVIAEMTR
ncbi:MAG: ABC transporter substrate-binding protein [Streptosporangiaceae bacterium]|nr:ABC transporter substrate-binding protein [Streptosporangiaceae bacterium]MBV9854799.1 ABC transporter substrate-binding protein [Streptosporangiaceae bacterium]